ncbi:MAG TPA: thiamine pyrophosphate-binding protein [Ktedonobacteraceae bacterium]|nr:thiamine pyrophosphate-binding protein [Ktedonobacteraceae bacterium]
MDESYTGGDVIVQALKAAGVECVFGIISIHNIPIYDAIARQRGIRSITNRSEPGAVNMADGYAKATGRLGVVITSTGAGAGNAAGALIEAQTHGTPLLHLTGQIDSPYLDQDKGFIHECKDQLGMLKAISKDAFRVRSRDSLAATIQHAIELAQTAPTGVVSVEIPIDVQKMLLSLPKWRFNFHTGFVSDPSRVKEAAEILLSAKRPLIWSGNGVIQAEACEELTHFAEMWGAGVLTSQAGRGAIPEDHPQCIGNFAYQSAIRDFIESCDVLLAVGTRFRGPETLVWRLPLPKTIVQIDVDELAISRNYPTTLGLVTDAKIGLQALIPELAGRVKPDPIYLEEVVKARVACRDALRATLGPYEQLCDDLRACLMRDALLATDVTISGTTWGSRLFPVYGPHQYIHAAGGGIGQGLQMGLGAKIGRPDRQVVVMVGDGGLQVNIGELGAAVQEEIAVVIVMFNDGGYGVLRNIQNRAYAGRHIGVDLHGLNFEKLCEAYGIHYYPVRRIEAFQPAIETALASGRLSLVEVDMGAVGPFSVPFAGYALNN